MSATCVFLRMPLAKETEETKYDMIRIRPQTHGLLRQFKGRVQARVPDRYVTLDDTLNYMFKTCGDLELLSRGTRDDLRAIGGNDDPYDAIIRRLIEHWKTCNNK